MGKRTEKKRTAIFKLEPDGFSIHTFELAQRLTKRTYHIIKNELYQNQQGKTGRADIYQECEDRQCRHRCTKFEKWGVRITLEHNRSKDEDEVDPYDTYFIRMVVNPRILIEPTSQYLGILPPDEDSIQRLTKAFKELFKDTAFEEDINGYYLSRVDLCTNIRCNNKKIFRELVRVLRKLPTPPKYKRVFYKGKDKKKTKDYNKHYLRLCCGTHELVIYDKTYQVVENNIIVDSAKLPEGVLRFEVHCSRAYIKRIEKNKKETDTTGILWTMVAESKIHLVDHFTRCFPDVEFVQMEELERRIKQSRFKRKNKELMLELSHSLQRIQSVDKALKKMEKQGRDTSDLLDKFSDLGISPIPLWKSFCAQSLPGPVELLKHISDGAISVDYIKVKYK